MVERIGGRSWSSWEAAKNIFWLLILSATLHLKALAQDAGFEQSVVECPGGDGTMGYIDISSINSDMKAELDRILAGAPSREPYIFSLCPSATFDASDEPLMPILSGSVFYCGTGDPGSARCDFIGGETQVLIDGLSDSPNHELQTVSFVGVTFKGFSEAAISGSAGSNTTVDLVYSSFEVSRK